MNPVEAFQEIAVVRNIGKCTSESGTEFLAICYGACKPQNLENFVLGAVRTALAPGTLEDYWRQLVRRAANDDCAVINFRRIVVPGVKLDRNVGAPKILKKSQLMAGQPLAISEWLEVCGAARLQ